MAFILLAGLGVAQCAALAENVLQLDPKTGKPMPTVSKHPGGPLSMSMRALKNIYRKREGLPIEFLLEAHEPIQLCLEKDPLTQFQLTVYRAGKGPMPLEPYVTKDTRELYFEKIRIISMKPGDKFPYRTNIKKIVPARGEKWDLGDYTVKAVFNLCDQTQEYRHDSAGRETPIKSTNSASFMITQ